MIKKCIIESGKKYKTRCGAIIEIGQVFGNLVEGRCISCPDLRLHWWLDGNYETSEQDHLLDLVEEVLEPTFIFKGHHEKSVDFALPKSLINLTKREQFAMAAMQGLISTLGMKDSVLDTSFWQLDVSIVAVKHADALIAELNKNETK